LIGGLLVHPGENYPGTFQDPFWIKYPYFLPGLVTAIYAFITAILSITALKEVGVTNLQAFDIDLTFCVLLD
jgi:hypothetical protein